MPPSTKAQMLVQKVNIKGGKAKQEKVWDWGRGTGQGIKF